MRYRAAPPFYLVDWFLQVAWALSLLLGASFLIAAEKPAPATRIKGCTVVVGFRDLRVFYERAVVVGERELPSDAPPEWWGFYPDRKPVLDRDGQQRAVNIPKDEFLRVGEVRIVRMKVCRCPPMFWGARSDVSAER